MIQTISQLPPGTKLFLILIISYLSITQLFLYSKANERVTKTKTLINKLNDFLDDELSKLTTMTFSTASFIRNIGKHSSNNINLKEIQKKIEKITKYHIENKNSNNIVHNAATVKTNQLSNSEQSPNEPLKISILLNTKNLKNFETSFRSIANTFENTGIIFRVYGLTSVDEDTSFQDGRFLIILYKEELESRNIQTELVEPLSDEDQKIFDQNSDWIRMMEKYRTICQEKEVFLYMDDEYELCPKSENFLISAYFWALKHRSNFASLRMGYNFNGMFLRCDQIGSIVEYVKSKSAKKGPIISIEDEVRNWWSSYNEYSPLKQFVFRYNLFKKRDDKSNDDKCLKGNNAEFVHSLDKFDTMECQKHLISPCDPSLQKELIYTDKEAAETKSILDTADRNLLMSKLKIKPLLSNGKDSCDSICTKENLICSKESFPFVNNCDVLKEQLKCTKCQVGNLEEEREDINEMSLYSLCFIVNQPVFECSSNKFKICPCRTKNDNTD
eukprot:gene4387-7762_t